MSFTQVKDLRKEGRLEEALKIALSDLNLNSNDIWNKRSIAWVYYELLKNAQIDNDINAFLSHIKHIEELKLPHTETMIFDSCAWSVGKLLFKQNKLSPVVLDNLFNVIRNFSFSRPKDSYSFMLKAFKKHDKEWNSFSDFLDWWGLNNFDEADYQNFILENGTRIPSLVESIYVSLAKIHLKEPYDIEKIKTFLPKIKRISQEFKNMQYPPYYYAKLLIVVGDRDHFMEAFLPFAKKKQREFWVWDLMSEVFNTDSEEYFSCLCKSLSCGADNKYTCSVREKLAKAYLKKQMYPQAKFEFEQILKTRQKEGWVLHDKHQSWVNLPWWNSVEANSNLNLYGKNTEMAESLLYANMPEEIMLVEKVNREKSVLNFIVSKEKHGFAMFNKFNISPRVGASYLVRFEKKIDSKSSSYNILSIKETDKMPSQNIIKKVNGIVNIKEGDSFGFVNDVYLPPTIIQDQQLKNDDPIIASAVISFDKKKKSWGWRIFKVNKNG